MLQSIPDHSLDKSPLEIDDELVFDEAEDLTNPLAKPLAAALRLIRQLKLRRDNYRLALKMAIEALHIQDAELVQLRRRNLGLIEELRTRRVHAA